MAPSLPTRRALYGSILVLIGCTSSESGGPRPAAPQAVAQAPSLEAGRTLYGAHCAVCHGERGDGQGAAAYLLSPLPRDFTSGRFRLVTTENSVPSQADLVAVLERGMPGSAMPPFEWLRPDQRESLALHVRDLAREGIVEGLRRYALEQEEDFDESEARQIAEHRTTPGAPIALGAPPEESAALLARGRELYQSTCALCHGSDGRARDVELQWNEDGSPTRPRDFTAGIFKGPPTREAIVQRLRCGLPGSPMPSTELERPEDAWALASHVLSLVRPGGDERVRLGRRTLVAARAPGLSEDPLDASWRDVPSQRLTLMPLWWRDERIEALELRVLHDGERIAFHLSWPDATRDEELLGTETFSDLIALQLSTEADPPLFAMGAAGRPVELWSWRAAWERDRERVRDVADRYPSLSEDLHGYQPPQAAPLFLTARAAGNPVAAAARADAGEELTAQGLGTVQAPAGRAAEMSARGAWRDGAWSVVFMRPLASSGPADLAAGSPAFVAAAVWDGSALERNGQKSVTVWHVLQLER